MSAVPTCIEIWKESVGNREKLLFTPIFKVWLSPNPFFNQISNAHRRYVEVYRDLYSLFIFFFFVFYLFVFYLFFFYLFFFLFFFFFFFF
jgi:hypothetical protein